MGISIWLVSWENGLIDVFEIKKKTLASKSYSASLCSNLGFFFFFLKNKPRNNGGH